MSAAPCPTCPWRRGSSADDIPNFDLAKARNLSCTVGDGDAFRTIMACHHSPEGGETSCRGYIAKEGWSNLSVRMAAIEGRIDIDSIVEASLDIDMFESFEEMLDDLEGQFIDGSR